VRERIAEISRGWSELLASSLRAAQAEGDLDPKLDIDQFSFELNAMLGHANSMYVLHGERRVFDWARRGIATLLDAARAGAASPSR
jgi:hypothetical protein